MHPIYNLLNQDKKQNEIFHYSSQDGFLGILETKSIWATQISCLNDASEFKLAIDLAKEILLNKKGEDYKLMLSVFDTLEPVIPKIFVCSFSEEPDLLSQWRAYGKNTGGLSIGFNFSTLQEQAEKQNFILVKCIYKPEEQYELMNRAIEDFFDNQINGLPLSFKEYYELDPEGFLKVAFFVYLMNYAPIIKDEGFQEEAEWRLISVDALNIDQISFRSGKSYIVPYFAFELGELNNIITKVYVGPTPHKTIGRNSVELALEKYNCSLEEEVQLTKIPYRNW